MSRAKNLDSLLRKREQLEREIAAAEVREKRKTAILAMPEFAQIIGLPDDVLRAEFRRIASENIQQSS